MARSLKRTRRPGGREFEHIFPAGSIRALIEVLRDLPGGFGEPIRVDSAGAIFKIDGDAQEGAPARGLELDLL